MKCLPLKTERLTLRPLERGDAPHLARLDADIDVMRYLDGRILTPEESEQRFERIFAGPWPEGYGVWFVSRADSGTFVGTVVLRPMRFVPNYLNEPELGYKLAREHWGQGFAEEAARAALQYGFDSIGLPRVSAVTDLANKASQRILRKLGFRYIGEEFFVAGPEARPEAVHFFSAQAPDRDGVQTPASASDPTKV